MNDKSKTYIMIRTAVIVLLSITVNFAGREFASQMELPVWLDSFGTVVSAYLLGPVCGALVGASSNMVSTIMNDSELIYCVTSIFVGLSVGIAAKKKYFNSFFHAMSIAGIVTIASTLISVSISQGIYGGEMGNIWGNAIRDFLYEKGLPEFWGGLIAGLYLEFLDKLVVIMTLFYILFFFRLRKKHDEPADSDIDEVEKQINEDAEDKIRAEHKARHILGNDHHAGIILMILLTGSMLSGMIGEALVSGVPAEAAETGRIGGADASYIQTLYGRDNGLPCGTANAIAQTTDGILWIGTYAGLYRYNGSEFQARTDYSSVKNVNCLYTDVEGRLWIGTNDNGLVVAVNDKIVNELNTSDGLVSDSIHCVTQDSKGVYYVGSADSLMIMILKSGITYDGTVDEVTNAVSLAADEDGHVAAVTAEGTLYLLKNRKIIDSIKTGSDEEQYSCCSFDEDGMLFAGTSNGKICMYDVSDEGAKLVSVVECTGLTKLNDIFIDEENAGICADNGIGFLYNKKTFVKKETVDFNYSVENMLIDYQGNMWFASSRLGILRLCRSSFTDIYGEAGFEKSVVNTTAIWQNNLYVGSDDGLKIIDISNGYKEIKNELTGALDGMRIRCMQCDSSGHLWICSYGRGLIEIDKNGKEKYYDSPDDGMGNRVRVCTELSDGTIAAGGDNGLSFIKGGKIINTIPYGDELGFAKILCFLQMADGRLMCGTDGNGIVTVKDGKVESTVTKNDGLTSGVILRLVKDIEGENIYAVTSSSICYIDENGIRELSNYPYSNNYDIYIKEDGTMFVLGSAGLYVFDRKDLLAGGTFEYQILDSQDGLAGSLTANAWNAVDEEHNLYLSTDHGVYMVNDDRYLAERVNYRIKISGLLINDEEYPIDISDTINIGRDTRKIEFIPQIINYSMEDPSVSYYLEGLETNSKVLPLAELSNVVYTNLPSGDYVFHLSIVDKYSGSVLQEASYKIVKEKSMYDNAWFVMYLVIVGGLFIGWFTWFITRTQIQRTLDLQQSRLQLAMQHVQMGNEAILAIAKTVDAKDVRTSKHSQRVSEYSVLIAKEIGFSEKEQENVRKAALLHDIGKIGIPDSILNKPDRLTDEEYAIMKSHVTVGSQILKDVTMVENVVDGARYHHERYDGKGYPDGLKGDSIPLYGRIIAVADAFDAMTANRIYRRKQDFDYVFEELKKGRGTQFDPRLLDVFFKLIEDKKIDLDWLYSADYKQGDGMDD